MMNYIKEYDRKITGLLNKKNADWKKIGKAHLVQISFIQHERLIHLLVTLTFGMMFILLLILAMVLQSFVFLAINGLVMVLLLPYIFHYFKLENSTQKMYEQYNEIIKKQGTIDK